jgi:hypothetical protein
MLGLFTSLAWGWVKSPLGNLAVGVSVLFVLWQADRAGQRRVGAERQTQAIEKATTNAIQKGNAAVSRSAAGAPGRLLDPHTRRD